MKDDMRPESHDADYDQVNPNDIVEYPHHRAAQLSQADEGTIFEFDETEKVFVPKSAFGMTADCVVAGFRWHKKGAGTMIGSLLLGLYDDDHTLHHVGVAAAFTATVRKQLVVELTPLRADALEDHPWRDWAVAQEEASAKGQRRPGATSRWNRGKDLSWEPLRPERVCEVAYDHMQGTRFRHAAKFLRWRPDKRPQDCRYDQLEVTPAYELDRVFGARDRSQPCAPASQGS